MRVFLAVVAVLLAPCAAAADSAADRLAAATDAFVETMKVPDKSIPIDLLRKAECVVIVPGMVKGAFIFGAHYGRGFVTCRRADRGGWSAPGGVRMEGGSFGFQIGGSATDVFMLVMNERGVRRLLSSQFTLGGDASVAAGPIGRSAAAQTDASMHAEILAWSRSRGVFAGIALSGATLREDRSANQELYGTELRNSDILRAARTPPAASSRLLAALGAY